MEPPCLPFVPPLPELGALGPSMPHVGPSHHCGTFSFGASQASDPEVSLALLLQSLSSAHGTTAPALLSRCLVGHPAVSFPCPPSGAALLGSVPAQKFCSPPCLPGTSFLPFRARGHDRSTFRNARLLPAAPVSAGDGPALVHPRGLHCPGGKAPSELREEGPLEGEVFRPGWFPSRYLGL